MVEIRYGEQYEQADLVGKSVAEAREQYKEEFGIPDKAQARLNGKPVKKKLEADTELGDGDELSFAEKSRSRGLVLIGAFLLALAVTGGVFAYGYTTATVTLGVIEHPEYATVRKLSPPPWDVWMGAKGDVPAGELFRIDPHDDFTGDLVVRVYLVNADELAQGYHYLNMALQVRDAVTGEAVDEQSREEGRKAFQLLTLENAVVTFVVPGLAGRPDFDVEIVGGSFMGMTREYAPDDVALGPMLWCEVTTR